MNKLISAAAFTIGAAVGSVVTWQILKTKYEQIAEEEIASVRELYSDNKTEHTKIPVEHVDISEPEADEVEAYAETVTDLGYDNALEKKPMGVEKPYVITPEEFGELDEYSTASLTYYDDKILADENDEMVEDVEDTVGFESLSHFGEYEDDSVYVRNDRLKCDFEILLDVRRYTDVLRAEPYKGRSYDEFENE